MNKDISPPFNIRRFIIEQPEICSSIFAHMSPNSRLWELPGHMRTSHRVPISVLIDNKLLHPTTVSWVYSVSQRLIDDISLHAFMNARK